MATTTIRIIIMESGSKDAADNIGKIGDRAKSSASSVDFLKSALVAMGAALSLKEITNMIDSVTQLRNRLRLVTTDSDAAAAAFNDIRRIADSSRVSLSAVGELYQRLASSTKGYGIEQKQLIAVTEAVTKGIQLSGVSAEEAGRASLQLAQGLTLGVLKGQDFRSVLTQAPALLQILADTLGVSVGQLKKMGEEGKLTTELLIQGFTKAGKKINDEFGKQVPTFKGLAQVIENEVSIALDGLAASFGSNEAATNFVKNFVTDLRLLVIIIKDGISQIQEFGKRLTDAFEKATGHTLTLNFGFKNLLLNVALIGDAFRGGIGAAIDYVADALTKLVIILRRTSASFLAGIAGISDSFIGIFIGIGSAAKQLMTNLWINIKVIFQEGLNLIIRSSVDAINKLLEAANAVSPVEIPQIETKDLLVNFVSPEEIKAAGRSTADAFMDGFKSSTSVSDALGETILGLLPTKAQYIFLGKDLGQAFKDNFLAAVNGADSAVARIKRLIAEASVAPSTSGSQTLQGNKPPPPYQKALDQIRESLQQEHVGLQLTNKDREVSNQLFQISTQLKKANLDLSSKEAEAILKGIEATLQRNAVDRERARVIDSVDGAMQKNLTTQAILDDLIRTSSGPALKGYQKEWRDLEIARLQAQGGALDSFKAGFVQVQQELADSNKLASQAVTDAFHGMEDAVVNFVKTGKLSFSSLVDSILADLTRLLFRQAILGIVNSFGSGSGGIFGTIVGAFAGGQGGQGVGHAAGGPVTAGTSYMVGERGPELFTPQNSGTITPNGGGVPPQVNVKVVNVSHPDEVNNQLNDPKVQDTIVNVIRRNRTAVKAALGVG